MTAYSDPSIDTAPSVLDFFVRVRQIVDQRLDQFVPSETTEPSTLHSAIRWSLLGAGKRLRPALVIASGRTFGAADDDLLDIACAFEMVHTYSLVHDDLPAMDDDDLRRGRPTCHVKFGEAIAVLVGDALQTMAFQIIAGADQLQPALRIRMIEELARAAGTPSGMIAGQVYDLNAESSVVSGQELETIHSHKTGALIVAAARCGAIIAGASEPELTSITVFASNLGLLFQITDDLLDITASAEDLGKTPGKDQQAQKATYPALYGSDGAEKLAAGTFSRAVEALSRIDRDTTCLHQIALFTQSRRS